MNHTLVIALTGEQEKKLAQAYVSHPEKAVLANAEALLLRWARHTPVMELEHVVLTDIAAIKAKIETASDAEIAAVKAALKIVDKAVEELLEP